MLDENEEEAESGIPLEILLLEMSGNDPLRAQEIEEKLSRRWFEWWSADRNARANASPKNR